MAKGPTPNFGDSVLKHAIVGIVKTYPHISPESLSGELHGTASVGRLAKLIKQSAKWNGRKWICTIRLGPTPDSNPLPSIVSVIKEDLKNGMKPMLIATKHGIEYSMVLGVNRGRYDGLLKTPRNSKKFVKVNNLLKLYDEKGYEPSGKSIKGALEVSDDCNQIRCHVCADWFGNLAAHVRYAGFPNSSDLFLAHLTSTLESGCVEMDGAAAIKSSQCAMANWEPEDSTQARSANSRWGFSPWSDSCRFLTRLTSTKFSHLNASRRAVPSTQFRNSSYQPSRTASSGPARLRWREACSI